MLNNKYENLHKFYEFLEERAKGFDRECEKIKNTWLEYFEKRIGETGSNDYELNRFETKSGRPEIIIFEVIDTFYDEDGNEIDTNVDGWQNCINDSETKIIF